MQWGAGGCSCASWADEKSPARGAWLKFVPVSKSGPAGLRDCPRDVGGHQRGRPASPLIQRRARSLVTLAGGRRSRATASGWRRFDSGQGQRPYSRTLCLPAFPSNPAFRAQPTPPSGSNWINKRGLGTFGPLERKKDPGVFIPFCGGDVAVGEQFAVSLFRAYANEKPPDRPPIQHRNIRGTGYYH